MISSIHAKSRLVCMKEWIHSRSGKAHYSSFHFFVHSFSPPLARGQKGVRGLEDESPGAFILSLSTISYSAYSYHLYCDYCCCYYSTVFMIAIMASESSTPHAAICLSRPSDGCLDCSFFLALGLELRVHGGSTRALSRSIKQLVLQCQACSR